MAPFIATLGMMTLLRGAALVLSNGSPISGFSSDLFGMLGGGYVARLIPVPVVLMLTIFAAFWFVLSRTVFGRHLYATGALPVSQVAARCFLPQNSKATESISGSRT